MGEDTMRLHSAADGQPSTFSYIGQHRYHVTLPVHGEEPVFTAGERVTPVLDMLRESGRAHAFEVFAYCFLPEQLQLVIRGRRETSDMRAFLSEFRTASSAVVQPVLGRVLWKKKYLERVLRKGEDILAVAQGMVKEPVKRGLAETPKAYPFAGSFVLGSDELMDSSKPLRTWEEPRGGSAHGGDTPSAGSRPHPGYPTAAGRRFSGGGTGFRRRPLGKAQGRGRSHTGHAGGPYRREQSEQPRDNASGFQRKHSSRFQRSPHPRFGRPPGSGPGRSQAGFRGRPSSGGAGGPSSRSGAPPSLGPGKKTPHGFSRKPSRRFTRGRGFGSPGERRPGFGAGPGGGKFGRRPTSPRGKRNPRRGFRPGGRRPSPGTGTP